MKLKVENVDAGQMAKIFNEAINEVAEDIISREDVTAKRKIILTATFKPNEAFIEVEYGVETKLPKDPARKSVAFADPAQKALVDELKLKQETPVRKING